MTEKKKFIAQAFLLTGVSLLLRSVGVSAQVLIARRIGTEAVGVSSLIGGVGGFAVTLALSGIQLGTTRQIAQGLVKDDPGYIAQTLKVCFLYAAFFGIFSGTLLFAFSPWIGRCWLHDLRTVASLRIMALTLPICSFGACISGYFIAVRRVYKSAVLQIAEEIVRLCSTIFFLNLVSGKGLESALIALSLSGAVADLFSGALLFILFRADRKKHFPGKGENLPPLREVGKTLVAVTLPVAVSAYARSGLLTLEHMLIPIGLKKFGLTQSAALSSYGALHSMALSVILYPTALLSSFSGLLIPEFTESCVRGNSARIGRLMEKAFSLTLFFSIGTSATMICFSGELGDALYHNPEVSTYIRLLSPLIPVMYLDSVVDAMLKGLGEQLYSMKINIADALLSVILVWILIPKFGIYGYVITIYISEIFNAALSVTRLMNVTDFCPRIFNWIAKPLACAVGATMLSKLLITNLPRLPLTNVGLIICHIVLTALIYFLFLILIGSVRREDLRQVKKLITS